MLAVLVGLVVHKSAMRSVSGHQYRHFSCPSPMETRHFGKDSPRRHGSTVGRDLNSR